MTRNEPVDAVRRVADELSISEEAGELVIHSIPDSSAMCSRTDVNVGGCIEVTARGR